MSCTCSNVLTIIWINDDLCVKRLTMSLCLSGGGVGGVLLVAPSESKRTYMYTKGDEMLMSFHVINTSNHSFQV